MIWLDCGAVLNGWHGDAAITVPVGSVAPSARGLTAATEEALWAGIAAAARAVRSGRGRLGDISHAIETSIRRAGRYGIVRHYGGHGIGSAMHQDPIVLNHCRRGRGLPPQPGLCLAIEPMLTVGSAKTVELADGSLAAHAEHSVALLDDGVWVLTADDGGASRLGDLLSEAARDEAAGVP